MPHIPALDLTGSRFENSFDLVVENFKGAMVMRVISKKRLRKFWEENEEARSPLLGWYKVARGADWKNFDDIRRFAAGSADVFKRCVVFNIGGNKYRLVVRVHYASHKVYIIGVLTHRDYDRGSWKYEC